MKTHVGYLSSLGTRVTGSRGNILAADYVKAWFSNIPELQVYEHFFNVVVPVDYGATLKVSLLEGGAFTLRAYPLWPNYIQTCSTPSLTAPMVYVGNGELEDMDGLEVMNRIALMEFNTYLNWIRVAEVGAKAVVFIEPLETSSGEGWQKAVSTSLHFPRLYIPREEGLRLKKMVTEGKVRDVTILLKMVYETVEAKNILAVLPGETTEEPVIIAAHYDSWSIVPSLAPGAEDSLGVSVLLETAQLLSKARPYRTIYFIAFSGHWQALEGTKAFVEDFFFQNKTFGLKRPYVVITLDFSSGSDVLAVTSGSRSLYRGLDIRAAYGDPNLDLKKMDVYLTAVAQGTFNDLQARGLVHGKVTDYVETWGLWDISTTYNLVRMTMLDGDPFTMAFLRLVVQMTTGHDTGHYWTTPFDTTDRINWRNVEIQLRFSEKFVERIVEDRDLAKNFNQWTPLGIKQDGTLMGRIERIFYAGTGFTKLKGQVVKYDMTNIKLYTPVPNTLVALLGDSYPVPYTCIYTYADSEGKFEVSGLAPDISGGVYEVQAFTVNWTDGRILYSPDQGRLGSGTYEAGIGPVTGPISAEVVMSEGIKGLVKPVLTAVFESSSIALFGIQDPGNPTYRPSVAELIGQWIEFAAFMGPGGVPTGVTVMPPLAAGMLAGFRLLEGMNFKINDFGTHQAFEHYGVDRSRGVTVLFAPPNTVAEVVVATPAPKGYVRISAVLSDLQIGEAGTQRLIPLTVIEALESMVNLAEERLTWLSGYKVYDPVAERSLGEAERLQELSVEALESEKAYSRAYGYALVAWSAAVDSYEAIMGTQSNIASSTIFLATMLVPFALLAEALFLGSKGARRLFSIIAIFVLTLLALGLLHPGLGIASSPVSMLMGFIVVILATPIVYMVFSEGVAMMKWVRLKVMGPHFVEVDRVGMAVAALSTGTSQMRKRKFRTVLSLTSIILVVLSLTTFTSLEVPFAINYVKVGEGGEYSGLALRAGNLLPISDNVLYELQALSGGRGVITWRRWYYPLPMVYELSPKGFMWVYGERTQALVSALLGVSAQEDAVTKLYDKTLIAGRPPEPGDKYGVMVSDKLAEELFGSDWETAESYRGAELTLMGTTLHVLGVFSSEELGKLKDFDGLPVAPLDSTAYVQYQGQVIPLTTRLIIASDELVQGYGSDIRSIAVKVEDEALIKAMTERLILSAPTFSVFLSFGGKVYMVTRTSLLTVMGLQFLLAPLIVGSLAILNMVLGAIYERTREIGILSSLGLPPLTVALMFAAEVAVLSVVGTMLGYVGGLGASSTLASLGAWGFKLNFASLFAVMAMGLTMGSALLASVYPLFKAARLVTPSVERRWQIKTKPHLDAWNIALPVTVSLEEAQSVTLYVKEYLDANNVPVTGKFYTEGLASIEEREEDDTQVLAIRSNVVLPPWEAGVRQLTEVQLRRRRREDRYIAQLFLKSLAGSRELWIRSNYPFVDEVRKQLLTWKALRETQRLEYVKKARELKGQSQ